MLRNIFKNDDKPTSDAFGKPATVIDYLIVGLWLVLLPFMGIFGYVYDVLWLFYIAGGLITLTEIVFLFVGALRCFGSIMLIVSCIIGYSITKSLWVGLMLGACITASILSVLFIIIMCFSGLATITNLFKKE